MSEQTMPRVNGKPFRCPCGGSVFTRTDATTYRCNACGDTYEGTPAIPQPTRGDETAETVDEYGPLGQCVYTMSTGGRCPRNAGVVVRYGSAWDPDLPAYGYCGEHKMIVTKPRDPRIHRSAKPLTRVEKVEAQS